MLITLGAEVEIASAAGRRTVTVDDFFVGDGVHNNVLQPGEVVVRLSVPARSRGLAAAYLKLRPRRSIDFPMLSVAFATGLERGLCRTPRLVVSAIAAKPKTVALDALLEGRPLDDERIEEVARVAHKQCHPLINVSYDQAWRQAMVPVFVKRTLIQARGG